MVLCRAVDTLFLYFGFSGCPFVSTDVGVSVADGDAPCVSSPRGLMSFFHVHFFYCAQQLIDKEVIFAEDVEAIFGKRPWASRSEEIISASKTSKELKEAEEQEAARAEEAEKEVKEEESRNTEASDNTESKN